MNNKKDLKATTPLTYADLTTAAATSLATASDVTPKNITLAKAAVNTALSDKSKYSNVPVPIKTLIGWYNSDAQPASGDAEPVITQKTVIRGVLKSKMYTNNFGFEGMVSIFGSSQFKLTRNEKLPHRLEYTENDPSIKIKIQTMLTDFGVDQKIADHFGNKEQLRLTNFMLDTHTKEFAVGVDIQNFDGLLEDLGLGFVNDIIDISDLDVFFSRLYVGP